MLNRLPVLLTLCLLPVLIATVLITPALITPVKAADTIDFNTGEGALQALRKVLCSLKDNEHVTYMWRGRAYSRMPGERDKLLFGVLGMNVRQCVTVRDAERGEGFRKVSREIMLYLHPQTGEILREWDNPWTGETVTVVHVANDPVNQPPYFTTGRDGKERRFEFDVIDGTAFINYEIPLFYTNALGGAYQQYVGGNYHATEIFDFSARLDDFADLTKDKAQMNIAWVRIAQWLPWMKMGSRPGLMYVNATGKNLNSWDDLPALIKNEIKANYPAFTAPPPGDDDRPNETSWTYFKKVIDKQQAE